MGEYIKYGFAELDEYGLDLFRTIEATEEVKDMLDKLAGDIDPSWVGRGKDAFVERTIELRQRIDKMCAELNTSKQKLDTAVRMHRENEGLNKQQVSALSEEDIF